jgi:hypothetical protein
MNLGNEIERGNLVSSLNKFSVIPPSTLSSHDDDCCISAKEWFLAMDSSFANPGYLVSPPSWLVNQYEWGPMKWPMYWCEIAKKEVIDCGGFAALSLVSFISRGTTSFPVQIIQLHTTEDIFHWTIQWKNSDCSLQWLGDGFVYHEAVGVSVEKETRIYDSTKNRWMVSDFQFGYGGTIGVRFVTATTEELIWGNWIIPPNKWISVLEPNIRTKQEFRSGIQTIPKRVIPVDQQNPIEINVQQD